jgi:hypothetical protein
MRELRELRDPGDPLDCYERQVMAKAEYVGTCGVAILIYNAVNFSAFDTEHQRCLNGAYNNSGQ